MGVKEDAMKELAQRELDRRRGISSASALPEDFVIPAEPEEPQMGILDPSRQVFPRETAKAGLPILGATGAAALGPPGLLASTALAGVGGGAGKLVEQQFKDEDMDLHDATVEGGKMALGTLGGGLIFKGLGKLAEKIFNPKALTQAEQRAAKFAEREGLPFPLSTGGGGAVQSGVSVTTLPARWATQKDAQSIAQFINRAALDEAPKLAPQAKPISQVVQKGKEFFQNIYFPAKEAGQEGFDKFVSTVGAPTPVRSANLARGVDDAIEALRTRGFITQTSTGMLRSSDKLGKYLIGLKQNPVPTRTLDDMEVIRKKINNLGSRSEVKTIKDSLKESILKDYDDVGAQLGLSARELAEEAINKSAKFFQLKREFPELEFFAKNIDDPKWLSLLFQGRNAKALTHIRNTSPELYKELTDTWLSNVIQTHARATNGVVGKVLDGPSLRKWVEANRKDLNKVLGKQKAQVLDNFSRYASFVTGKANKTLADEVGGFETVARATGELGAVGFQPHIMIPGEVAAYVLAKGLSNPQSKLFKVFTQGPSETFKKSTAQLFKTTGAAGAQNGGE